MAANIDGMSSCQHPIVLRNNTCYYCAAHVPLGERAAEQFREVPTADPQELIEAWEEFDKGDDCVY